MDHHHDPLRKLSMCVRRLSVNFSCPFQKIFTPQHYVDVNLFMPYLGRSVHTVEYVESNYLRELVPVLLPSTRRHMHNWSQSLAALE